MRPLIVLGILLVWASGSRAQDREPILDMHLHAMAADQQGPPPLAMCTPFKGFPVWDPQSPYPQTMMRFMKEPACEDPVWSPETDAGVMQGTIEVMERLNIIGVLSGSPERVAAWQSYAQERFIPGLGFNLGRPNVLSVDSLRKLAQNGSVQVLAEVGNQYSGIAPGDDRMEPYWALAEELELPVGIHIGPGPPGVTYLGATGYRAEMSSALSLEPVLVRHPRLRVYIMHAGYPLLDDLLALLYAHPQVYVDVGVIVYTRPRADFYRFLQAIFDGGFGKRVMFGSDQMVWPGVIERAIATIEEAPFLTEEEKRDVLYNNAARFLRLSDEEIERHHDM